MRTVIEEDVGVDHFCGGLVFPVTFSFISIGLYYYLGLCFHFCSGFCGDRFGLRSYFVMDVM